MQVNQERLKLLQHPLISRYIEYKWWRVVFPLIVLYLLLYIVFLIFLTSFSISMPRPGPDNQYCKFQLYTIIYSGHSFLLRAMYTFILHQEYSIPSVLRVELSSYLFP